MICHLRNHAGESGVSGASQNDVPVTVSLTTYGKRIQQVAYTIESIMAQTLKPERIVLWLDEKDASDPLPVEIINQCGRGLTVVVTPDEIGPYKKLMPAMMAYPDSLIITVDDDCIYYNDLIERLVESYNRRPHAIHAARIHEMKPVGGGVFMPYDSWPKEIHYGEEVANPFFTGVGGVAYPPGIFDDTARNSDLFMRLSPTADDVWLNAMALRCSVPVVKVRMKTQEGTDYAVNPHVQSTALMRKNCGSESGNDKALKAVFDYFGLWNKVTL